ncbi:MAG: sulfotransferase [Croceibacterium sp.]
MTLLPSKSGAMDRDVAALRLVQQFQQALVGGSRAEVVDPLRELIRIAAPMAGQWLQLAPLAADFGEFGLAREAVDLFVESHAADPAVLVQKANILAYIGAVDEALAVWRAIPTNVPDAFSHAMARGALSISAGATGEARQWIEQALRLRPESGQAWHLLATLADFAAEPQLADRLLANEARMQTAHRIERAYYSYACGRALSERGEHGLAFATIARAAGETRAQFPFDRAPERESAAAAVSGYDASTVAALAREQTEATDRSIFVMGLPRSGTSLVQQILTSHSAVSDGGEINLLRWLVREAGNASHGALESYVRKAGAPSLARLWQHLLDQRFPAPGRVVDKTTNTTRKLGMVAALLPEAPLIWIRRDPLDCAWSCYRTCFMENVHWSNDLRDIAYVFRLEDELLRRWQDILGERLLVVPFEDLVTEPEPWTRRILSHCGLSLEPRVLVPHENRGAMLTASALQVRRPVNRAGVGSAEPYRAHLEPFIDAYYQ